MARKSPEQLVQRIRDSIRAWEMEAPDTELSRHSLEEFKRAMQPALDAHARVLAQREQLRISILERDSAVRRATQLVYMIGFHAKGHPEHGPDSALCEALGYTREVVRIARIRRARRRSGARANRKSLADSTAEMRYWPERKKE